MDCGRLARLFAGILPGNVHCRREKSPAWKAGDRRARRPQSKKNGGRFRPPLFACVV